MVSTPSYEPASLKCECGRWVDVPSTGNTVECVCGARYSLMTTQLAAADGE